MYCSPIGSTSLTFYCIEDSEKRAEKIDEPSSLDGESSRYVGCVTVMKSILER